ncbi:MAG: hypothetical protein ACLU3I_01635 [Acutalibacteraceae bacterium]
MSQIKPHTLSGFMELLPQPQLQMEAIMEILRNDLQPLRLHARWIPPSIEACRGPAGQGRRRDGKADLPLPEGRQRSGAALRSDRPAGKVRRACTTASWPSPSAAIQIGKVYRGERAQRGRFREFYQADIDIIGDGKLSITNEAEIPSIIYKTSSRRSACALPDPREQPQDSERLLRHARPVRAVRRYYAHRRQARQDRLRQGSRPAGRGVRRGGGKGR